MFDIHIVQNTQRESLRVNMIKLIILGFFVTGIFYTHRIVLYVVLVIFLYLPGGIKLTWHRSDVIWLDKTICLLTTLAWIPLLWPAMEFLSPLGALVWLCATWPKIIWMQGVPYKGEVKPEAKPVIDDLIERGIQAHQTKDFVTARKCWTRAASLGDPVSMNWLGMMYANKGIFRKDISMAMYWLKHAARRGNAEAQYNLGEVYLKYKKSLTYLEEGKFWLKKAEMQGDLQARRRLMEVKRSAYFNDSRRPFDAFGKVVGFILVCYIGLGAIPIAYPQMKAFLISLRVNPDHFHYFKELINHPGYYTYAGVSSQKEMVSFKGLSAARRYIYKKELKDAKVISGKSDFNVPVRGKVYQKNDTTEVACGIISHAISAENPQIIRRKYVWLSYDNQLWIENDENQKSDTTAAMLRTYCRSS